MRVAACGSKFRLRKPAMAKLLLPENPDASGFDRNRLDRIRQVVEADVSRGVLPGAEVLIARRGEIVYWKAFGFRDREANASANRDDIYRLASMTKPVTSCAVMMLAEQGRVSIPEPLHKYLPEFAETKVGLEEGSTLKLVPQQQPMTVQDLLRHTAGLTYGLFGTSMVKSAYNEAGVFDLRISNEEMTRRLAALPLANQPGQVWDYSMATDVLGRLVEVLSGQTLGDFFAQNIFAPLGMEDTGFLLDVAKAGRMAQPQVNTKTGQRTPMADHTVDWPWQSGGAGLFGTVSDYAHFCQMLLGRGAWPSGSAFHLLAPSTVALMTADHLNPQMTYDPVTPALFEAEAPTPEMGQSFGLGFALRTHTGRNPLPGSVGDYYWAGALGTYFWVDPAEDLFVIFMSQCPELRLHYRYVMRQLVYQALTK